ncbi:hypothetical protein [Kibdelosporangium phytohabitans]|uniref:Uncharacterized protein n=1 Tax=Kibdelosporangium phytohabitans TaxID=860235 RepID=A0A0N9HRU6_9PSEU|nr:hypothetical protein [Kibdelosporangium phytohabitans]ALG05778.1 hypothetical protein AOZ06_01530 [Kibdelosporangium phytohabitans]MBE1466217.1 hypothetical protein [Kibdelosporangium phytohabitans]
MSFVRMVGYQLHTHPDGVAVTDLSASVTLGDGTVVVMPAPFVHIGHRLGVCPAIEPSGDTGIVFDLSRWAPVYLDGEAQTMFPFHITGQGVAATIARAFHADPATSWSDPRERVETWLRSHGPDLGLHF